MLVRATAVAIAFVLAMGSSPSAWASQRCKVTDPTGTPLNIRDLQMNIIGTIDNGVVVYLVRTGQDPKGKSWALVANENGDELGWVYREFISCS